jgi:hypothetical protein
MITLPKTVASGVSLRNSMTYLAAPATEFHFSV